MNTKKTIDNLKSLVEIRKKNCSQLEVAQMTGVSRPHIANFEAGRVNNMYLYDFYLYKFGGSLNEKKTTPEN